VSSPFLVESQRRVIEHCERLLGAHDLTADYRERLTRLTEVAEADCHSACNIDPLYGVKFERRLTAYCPRDFSQPFSVLPKTAHLIG
jgi:hypothetical protein